MSEGRPRAAAVVASAALVLVLGLAVAQLVRYWAATLSFPFSLDYGEGPLLDQAVRLTRGRSIYRIPGSEPPWTIANYPPIYPALVSAGVDLWGPTYAVGRSLSIVGAVLAAIFTGLIVARLTHDRLAAGVSAALVVVSPYVAYWSGFARVDPTALALSLAGLWSIVRRPRSRAALLVGAVLLGAAILTKQTYLISAPLAAFVALWRVSRRRALAFAAVLVALVAIAGAVLVVITRGGFWFDVITANANTLDPGLLVFYGLDLLRFVPGLIGFTVLAVVVAARRRHPGWPIVVAYLAGAVIIALTVAKVGSAYNYLFELSVALSLAVGLLLALVRAVPAARLAVIIVLVLQVLSWVVLPNPYLADTLEATHHRADVEHLRDLVEASPGPVLADQEIGLLPPAGRTIELQPFELTQLAESSRWDQQPVLDAIEHQTYATIMIFTIPEWPLEETRWTPEQLAAIRQHYTLVERVPRQHGTTLVYRPRA